MARHHGAESAVDVGARPAGSLNSEVAGKTGVPGVLFEIRFVLSGNRPGDPRRPHRSGRIEAMSVTRRSAVASGLLPLLAVILLGCGSAAPSTTDVVTGSVAALPAASATPSAGPAGNQDSGGMHVRFVNLTDGGTAAATGDSKGRPLFTVQIEVTGGVAVDVLLTANDLPAVDEGGHQLIAENTSGAVPFTAEIPGRHSPGGASTRSSPPPWTTTRTTPRRPSTSPSPASRIRPCRRRSPRPKPRPR
jgi:hypothetical protein